MAPAMRARAAEWRPSTAQGTRGGARWGSVLPFPLWFGGSWSLGFAASLPEEPSHTCGRDKGALFFSSSLQLPAALR